MAIGGALRAAIRAGKFGVAARESRQNARALRTLNRTGGVGRFQRQLPLEERGFERMLGRGYGATPRGNAVIVDPATGSRTVLNQGFDDYMEGRPPYLNRFYTSPYGTPQIEAPYEGFRVLPGRVDRYGDTSLPPGPWQGRGRGTEWAELPVDGGPPYVNGSYFEPFPGRNPVFPERLQTFPWTRFGQYPDPNPFPMR